MRLIIQHGDDWLSFENPVEVLTARTPDEVFQCLEAIEQSGLWAAGFVSYEAASAFDDALQTHEPGNLPLLQFGLFEAPESVGQTPSPAMFSQAGAPAPQKSYQLSEWEPSVTRGEYSEAIASIKEHIAAGDTYQVNYTFRLNAEFSGDDFAICSASPELFFELNDGTITSRPMKGTLPRGLTFSNDWKNAETLKNSPKDRAENIMIVDMIRNDIGRVAEAGSVETLSRFDVEKYPTVWQMTSTVVGKVKGPSVLPTSKVWKNLFPCASITGAPKVKTMEIIQGLETSSRGIYTGSIGFIAPDGNAQFNVAIRTAVIQDGKAEYGIGGGIVWDSDAESEYKEAITKAAILTKRMPDFQCLETMIYEDGEIFLLERHLKRLAESAEYFDFEIDLEKIREELDALSFDEPMRIRLLLNKDGLFDFQALELLSSDGPAKLAIAKEPVDSKDVFLYHKTTNRAVYEKVKADFPAADDVLLYNERGEITESCRANVVVELDGRKVTPPVSCGLLSGTFRDELLERGEIEEGAVTLDDLKRADSICLINSVRKRRSVILI